MFRAIKIVRREDFEYERTFEREFEGIQRYEQVSKDHPGLVDVLHVGRDDEGGFYYYVMELADDKNGEPENIDPETYRANTLSSEMKATGAKSILDTVNLGISLAGALGHLHEAGLTHRDVKPSNIIFVKGVPKLADVGLVAQSGQRTYVGTEGYVPPEGPGTSSADLYSLAMVLYEVHTEKDRLDFPELPTNLEIHPTVNRDEWRGLNTVICRAGSPDPRKRYESARALAIALREVIEGSHGYRSGRKGSKVRNILVTIMVLGLLAITGYGGYWVWKDSRKFWDDNSDHLSGKGKGSGNSTTISGNDSASGTSIAGNTAGNGASDAGQEDPDGKGKGKAADTSNNGGGGKGGKSGKGAFTIIDDENDNMINGEVVIRDEVNTNIKPPKIDTGSEDPKDHPKIIENDPVAEIDPKEDPDKNATTVVAEKVAGQIKLMSRPSGATVWVDGEEVGITPRPLVLPVGAVEIVLKFPGYHDLVYQTMVKEGFVVVEKSLIEDRRPAPGTSWVNSLGVRFEPDYTRNSVTVESVSTQLFDTFNSATGQLLPSSVRDGLALVTDQKGRWAFADWMTEVDRGSGYLSSKQYYRPIDGSETLGNHDFKLVVDNRMGTILLNSEPTGALIRQNGKVIGDTEETISNLRLGPYEFQLDMPGYQLLTVAGQLNNVIPVPVNHQLVPNQSVVFGSSWTNSLGMALVPVGDLLVASYETPLMDYRDYVTDMQISMPVTVISQELNHPVTGVTRNEAQAFCDWLTLRERSFDMIRPTQRYRLPTDVEWSLFAGITGESGNTPEERGRQRQARYPWGDAWPPPSGSGNYADESASGLLRNYVIAGYNDNFPATSVIGSLGPRENGMHDLSGNVWEWVSDRYGSGGHDLGGVRGGGWNTYEQERLSLHYRNPVPMDSREDFFGFRYLLEDIGDAP